VGSRLHVISLGQGQGPIAESVLAVAVKMGDWVCLQVSKSLTSSMLQPFAVSEGSNEDA
jgi:dynein heavy chain